VARMRYMRMCVQHAPWKLGSIKGKGVYLNSVEGGFDSSRGEGILLGLEGGEGSSYGIRGDLTGLDGILGD
jgi:hypothetical protein